MYFAIKGGAPPPWQMIRAQVCERMGWTLDYYDSLDIQDRNDLLAVWDGMAIASQKRGAKGT